MATTLSKWVAVTPDDGDVYSADTREELHDKLSRELDVAWTQSIFIYELRDIMNAKVVRTIELESKGIVREDG